MGRVWRGVAADRAGSGTSPVSDLIMLWWAFGVCRRSACRTAPAQRMWLNVGRLPAMSATRVRHPGAHAQSIAVPAVPPHGTPIYTDHNTAGDGCLSRMRLTASSS